MLYIFQLERPVKTHWACLWRCPKCFRWMKMLGERSRDNLQRISLYSGTEFLINYLFPEKIGVVKRIWTYQGYHAQGVETQWNFRLRKNKKQLVWWQIIFSRGTSTSSGDQLIGERKEESIFWPKISSPMSSSQRQELVADSQPSLFVRLIRAWQFPLRTNRFLVSIHRGGQLLR